MAGWGSFPWGSGSWGDGSFVLPELTLFTREMGLAQGRHRPTNTSPLEGNWLVCLGSDTKSQRGFLGTGDYIRIRQTNDVGAAKLLRPRFRLRAADEALPAGVAWHVRMLVDGVAALDFELDRTQSIDDLAINASGLGAFTLAFELAIVGSGGPWEVELPAVYLDALVLDATAVRPLLANRLPGPAASEVPRATLVQLDVMDTTASGIDLAETQVYVDGVLAFDAGTFQAGFNGGSSAHSSLDGGRTRRVIIDPTTDFASEAVVTVRVVSATNDGLPLDESYGFTIEDVTPPMVVSAQATTDSTVRVAFDEAVLQLSSSGAADALNPANWAIELVSGAPAVWVEVLGVAAVDSVTVEIATDIPMTPRAVYRARAADVADLFDNVVAAPNDAATFTAVGDQAPGRDYSIGELLPPFNEEIDEGDYAKFIGVLDEVIGLLLRRIDRWPDITDIDLAPEVFVDAMLQDLSNPFDFELTLVEKRRLGRLLIPIFRSKGLQRGIISAIRLFMGIEVTIEYPHFRGLRLGHARIGSTFRLGGTARDAYSYEIISPQALTDEERSRIRAIATYMQVAHEHLVRIVEPAPPPPVINHLQLGRSRLGTNWILH